MLRRISTTLLIQGVISIWFCAFVLAQDAASRPATGTTSISFEHDSKGVTGFAAYVTPDGAQALRIDLGLVKPNGAGKIVAHLPELPPGTYTIEVVAYNTAGESQRIPASPSPVTVSSRSGASGDHAHHDSPPAKADAAAEGAKANKQKPPKKVDS